MRARRTLAAALLFPAILSAGVVFLAKASHLRAVQSLDDEDLEAGKILVADRKLRDPNFLEAVILLAKYDDEGTVGIIVNRQTDVSIARVLSDWREARGRKDPVFLGGPVEKGTMLALVRSAGKIDNAEPILRDVHFVADRDQMQKHLASGAAQDKFRLYLGYAGWGPEQLETEIEAGAWHVMPASAKLVFDPEPDTLWARLIAKTETRIARSPGQPVVQREQRLISWIAPMQRRGAGFRPGER